MCLYGVSVHSFIANTHIYLTVIRFFFHKHNLLGFVITKTEIDTVTTIIFALLKRNILDVYRLLI